jgi:hypothetical protein
LTLTFVGMSILLDSSAAGEQVQPPRRTVSGIHIWTDRSVDCFSRETLLRSLIRPGMSDEEKAIAFWRFVHRRIYHFPRADDNDPMRVLNVYGYSLCGTIQHVLVWMAQGQWDRSAGGRAGLSSRPFATERMRRIMGAGWLLDSYVRLDGIKAPGKMGHSWCQLRYEGREHFMDAHAGFMVWTADGKSIASIAEISGDFTLVSDPVKTGQPFMPCDGGRPEFFYRCAGGGFGKGLEKTDHSMALRVRPGETLTLHFDKLPGGLFKRSFSWKGQWDPKFYAEGPHHRCMEGREKHYRHYGNGEIVYSPDLSAGGFREALAASTNLAGKVDDGRPGLHPAEKGKPAEAVFEFSSPYVMVGGELSAEATVPKGATARFLLEAPDAKRKLRAPLAEATGTGEAVRVGGEMDFRALRYPYRARLRIQLPPGATLSVLKVRIVTQLTFHTLPRLMPGKNRASFECTSGDPGAAGLRLTWEWTEAGGKARRHSRKIEGRKDSYEVEVGEIDTRPAENPKYMKTIRLSVPE